MKTKDAENLIRIIRRGNARDHERYLEDLLHRVRTEEHPLRDIVFKALASGLALLVHLTAEFAA